MDTTTPHLPRPPAPAGPASKQALTTARRSRLPSAAEALGWGGGLTTVVGVVAVTWDFWSTLSGPMLVGLLLAATTVLGVAAAVVGTLDHDGDDQLAANLSVALWWMAGIAATVTCYVGTDVVVGGRAFLPLLAASLATTAMTGAAAVRTGRDSAAAGAILSAATAAFSAASLVPLDDPLRAAAVTLTALGAGAGLVASDRDGTRISWGTTMVLLLGSTEAVLATDGGLALIGSILLGLVLLTAGVAVRRSTGEAITAALLTALVTCQLAYEVAPAVFGLSTTILLIGIAMTGACIWLVRRAPDRG